MSGPVLDFMDLAGDPAELACRDALTAVADLARARAAELVIGFERPSAGAHLLADLANALDRFAIAGADLPRARGRSFLRVVE